MHFKPRTTRIVHLMAVLLAGLVTSCSFAKDVASGIKPEDVPKGVIKSSSFSQSAIFPGTVRDVSVFIPAQYDGSKPACVYVKTDGYNPGEKAASGNADRHQGDARDHRRVRHGPAICRQR